MQAESHVTKEIASQPDCWRRAPEHATTLQRLLGPDGDRIAVIGCGTSLFMAEAFSSLRERQGHGLTDAFAASEVPPDRSYDVLLAITRSGTTTEVLDALTRRQGAARTVVITADSTAPAADVADHAVVLDFADEQSVVQTRFATTALAVLRATIGHDMEPLADQASAIVTEGVADDLVAAPQLTFLGRHWTVGLAHEAALKLREASRSSTESYPAMEYRHGPIAMAESGRVVWMFGVPPEGLPQEVLATGAQFVHDPDVDPMVDLVRAQKVAVARALARGLDPDRPRNLNRSVILQQA
jgi:fructoselysine-6-P-deglycase FrlB-like protein